MKKYLVNIMGIRGEESRARAERGAVTVFGRSKRAQKTFEKLKSTFANTDSQVQCEGGKDKVNIYPIFDLTEKEIFEIIQIENLKLPDAYKDCKRLGCAFCSFASKVENFKTIKECPNLVKAWLRTLDGDVFQKTQKTILEKTDEIGLFYLYITKALLSNKTINKGLEYLNSKDIFGQTGYDQFKQFITSPHIMQKNLE